PSAARIRRLWSCGWAEPSPQRCRAAGPGVRRQQGTRRRIPGPRRVCQVDPAHLEMGVRVLREDLGAGLLALGDGADGYHDTGPGTD
ncbi:MAG TPA: hypothetical protein VE196_08605, partial [Pseudonocardiaceae bacterium]|nr:hypothetical protein [Pseudonocardiaceae bacterium]